MKIGINIVGNTSKLWFSPNVHTHSRCCTCCCCCNWFVNFKNFDITSFPFHLTNEQTCKYRITLPVISRRQHLPLTRMMRLLLTLMLMLHEYHKSVAAKKGTEVNGCSRGLRILSRQIRVAYRHTFAHYTRTFGGQTGYILVFYIYAHIFNILIVVEHVYMRIGMRYDPRPMVYCVYARKLCGSHICKL